MKSIFLVTIMLASTVTFSQESCLKTTTENKEIIWLCQESDKINFYFFSCYNKAEICFTGEALSIIKKINGNIFSNGDGGIGLANYVDQNKISFVYGDVGTVCDLTINKCN